MHSCRTGLQEQPPLHELLESVSWLLGRWQGEGCGTYPTISPFSYGEEVVFGHMGQPVLTYQSRTWKLANNAPMHNEMGFMQIKPGSSTVAFIIAQNNGLAEVEEGEVKGQEIHMRSNSIGRTTFGSEPQVLQVKDFDREKYFGFPQIERIYRLLDPNTLELCCFMETSNTALQKHLHITYKKMKEM